MVIRGGVVLPLNPEDKGDRKIITDPKHQRMCYYGDDLILIDEDKNKLAPLVAAELDDFALPTFLIPLICVGALSLLGCILTYMTWSSIPADQQTAILAACKSSHTGSIMATAVPTKITASTPPPPKASAYQDKPAGIVEAHPYGSAP